MNERRDFEELLWSDEESTVDAGGDRQFADQLEIHHLLRETVGRRPVPAPSVRFDPVLARRLRRGVSRRPLRGRTLALMTAYWLAFAVGVAIVLADLNLPLPPVSSWTLALWSALVPASFLLPLLGRRMTRGRRLLRL